MKQRVDGLVNEAGEMTQHSFDHSFNMMLDNYTPETRRYLKEKMADVPRMIAKEEGEFKERGKPWSGDEPRPDKKKMANKTNAEKSA